MSFWIQRRQAGDVRRKNKIANSHITSTELVLSFFVFLLQVADELMICNNNNCITKTEARFKFTVLRIQAEDVADASARVSL